MIEVNMAQDIREYSPKILGPFTLRQIICLAIAFSYGIPIMLLVPLGFVPRVLIGALCMLPVLLCGWITFYRIPLEKFVFKYVLPAIFGNTKLKYKTENTFSYLDTPKKEIRKVRRTRKIKGYK